MARTISDEQIKLAIIINGDPAQKQLLDLETATREVTKETNQLKIQRRLLADQGKKDTAEWRALDAAIRANTITIDNNRATMVELQNQIGITSLTMAQLTEKARLLQMALRNSVPNSEDYNRYQAELGQVNNRLDELRGRSRTAQSSIGTLADSFNRYQGIALAAVASLTGVALSIQKIIDINGKLSDAQSDVMKTTGMTKVEVDELTKSFGLLQTRTSRIDLLGIAEQGGRIGIAKAEIGDFVAVMNKASVALGDSFTGGAEEVANKLGKIKFLFEQTKGMNVDQSYNAIGSAINDLGANGVASEANIADFTTRIGSLTDVLKPTIQETLALGTAFEESGIESEVSARAYGIFMKQASTETSKFAQVMGISEQKVRDMINSNPLEFMLQFSQGMKGMNATDTAKTLDGLGIAADGANKVIGAMGNNTARFRELIELSNNSFASGTSLINEYELKNNNLAATLEKISKTVSGWFSSETFIKWLTVAVDGLARFIGATADANGISDAWKNTLIFTAKIIGIVTAAIVTNIGWQKLVALWTNRNTEANLLYTIGQKASAFATGLATIATQAQAVAVNWATGQTVAMKEAQVALGLAMKTTPWGFILSAISAIAVAYVMFKDNVEVASEVQKEFANIHNEATKNIAKQKSELELLTKVAQDNSAAQEKRVEAIKKLNEIIPDHIGILTLENIKNQEGLNILKAYTDEIYKNARARAVKNSYDKLVQEQVSVESKSLASYRGGVGEFFNGKVDPNFKNDDDIKNWASAFTKKLKDKDGNLIQEGTAVFYKFRDLHYNNMKAKLSGLLDDKNQELSVINAKIKALEPEVTKNTIKELGNKDASAYGSSYNVLDKAGAGTGNAPNKNPNSSQAEINKLKLEEQAKYNERSLKLARQIEDDKIAAMQDGYEKEMLIETTRFGREIQDLNRQKVHTDEFAKLDDDIAKAKEAKDNTKYKALMLIKKGWSEKNKDLDDQINAVNEGKLALHIKKLSTIEEKGAKDAIEKSKKAFDDAKLLRETKFNEEYAALGKNERAKAKLKKEFELSEIVEQEKFLKELIDKFNVIVGGGTFEKMDLSLLTPEQAAVFTAEAAKIGLTLSELINKKNELAGKQISNADALGVSKGNTDIFGFTPDNWVAFSDNLAKGKLGIDEMVFALSALTNAWGQYNEFVTTNENAKLRNFEQQSDAKKNKLKKQLDSGVISQKSYDRQVSKIDKELDAKKADLEYKQAKRQKALAVMNIIMSTAQAIIGIWAQFPKFDFGVTAAIMSGVVGALGALQIATVLATPLPAKGHEDGLYQDYVTREQDGKKFKSTYGGKTRSGLVSKTSHFLVAENGPEMVIDNKAWTQMNPAVKDSLIRELRGVKGFEQGLYNPAVQRYEVPAGAAPSSSSNDAMMNQMLLSVIAENTAVLKDLRENGVVGKFFRNDLKSMKEVNEGIKDFNDLRNKNKN